MEKNKNKNITVIIIAALAVTIISAVVIIVGMFMPERKECIQGQVEMTDYRVSSKIPARVAEIKVREGDRVHRGDTLVLLEAPDIHAKLSQAEAAYAAAHAQERKARNGTRQEQIRQGYATWQKAKAALDVAEKTYRRINRLTDSGVMAMQKCDEAKAQYEAAQATERAAYAQYDMAVNGARIEDREAAEAQARQARETIREVVSYMEETILIASADGQVTEIYPEKGELVGAGAPVMKIACADDAWLTFNVREDLLPELAVGSEVKVYIPAIDKEIAVCHTVERRRQLRRVESHKGTRRVRPAHV